ncbi:hypothetical protein [Methylobacterium nonmethylotrophicum]|uniref:Uncharacterized protein n=1 Tax=Methylobacterium nonmethylotrophicum TaxID=1141884 RepID=A0A4Z0NVS9_9HYPH|nr:hypothetical protein [Methylobacterium nonmethylotrophicum]TGE01451.1 hypothetical protein EU555_04935 [Methylobacterium nonmethylotrophicum]
MASGLQPEGEDEQDGDEAAERERAQLARDILVHNEQVKLTANLMNIGAAGFAITGIVAPLTAAMATTGRVTAPALALMVVWFVLGVGLHFGARLTLTTLR